MKYYRRCVLALVRLYGKLFLVNYYATIHDLPAHNWFRVHDTGDMSYLLRNRKKIGTMRQYLLSGVWADLYDQYIEAFGFSKEFLTILEKQKEVALLQCEKIMSNDKSLNAIINVAKSELNDMRKDTSGGNYMTARMHIEKVTGVPFNLRTNSVYEFYSYLKSSQRNGSGK